VNLINYATAVTTVCAVTVTHVSDICKYDMQCKCFTCGQKMTGIGSSDCHITQK